MNNSSDKTFTRTVKSWIAYDAGNSAFATTVVAAFFPIFYLEFWASSLQFTKKGDILIWDSHFGPNESGTPLIELETSRSWKKLKEIIPDKPIITMNNQNFEIHVFEKMD